MPKSQNAGEGITDKILTLGSEEVEKSGFRNFVVSDF